VGFSLGFFGLLRSGWVEGHLVLPLTRFQQTAAEFYAGQPAAPINVTAECSGTDVLALFLAAILAWPAPWRTRLAGAAGGIGLILTLNTIRIGTLGQAAGTPALFETLHLQIWPAILVIATSLYVFHWMRGAPRTDAPSQNNNQNGLPLCSPRGRRFAFLAALLLVAFAFCGPWIASSETLLAAGAWTAGEAALLLGVFGVAATAWGNVLATNQGAFMVTPECLATALVPLYFAAVLAAPLAWPRRLLALLMAPVLFAGLAIARLLLLALPPVVAASPLVFVHGFYQLVLGVLLVAFFAWRLSVARSSGPGQTALRTLTALVAALLFAVLIGETLTGVVLNCARALAPAAAQSFADIRGLDDIQGALASLVAFQSSLLLGLTVAMAAPRRRVLASFTSLFVVQIVFVMIVGEVALRSGEIPHALLLRTWAIGLPVALMLFLQFLPSSNPHPRTLVAAHDSP
jgi:exosortase/archaeosortase family protein